MIVPRLISRFDTERKDRGFTEYTEKCPICKYVNQNFLGFTDTGGAERLVGVVMCCLRCGALFLSREFLKKIDVRELGSVTDAGVGPGPNTQEDEPAATAPGDQEIFKCGKCGREVKSRRGLQIHEGACNG